VAQPPSAVIHPQISQITQIKKKTKAQFRANRDWAFDIAPAEKIYHEDTKSTKAHEGRQGNAKCKMQNEEC